jgi:hypothetical protein
VGRRRGRRGAGELRAYLGEGGEDGGVVARRVEGADCRGAVELRADLAHASGSDDSFSTATPTPPPSRSAAVVEHDGKENTGGVHLIIPEVF